MDSISIRVKNQDQKTALVRWLERMFHLADFYAVEPTPFPHAVYISDTMVNSCTMMECTFGCAMSHQLVDFETGIECLKHYRGSRG